MTRSIRPIVAKTLEEAKAEIQRRIESKEITEGQAIDLIKFVEKIYPTDELISEAS
jgi:hypothetical protein